MLESLYVCTYGIAHICSLKHILRHRRSRDGKMGVSYRVLLFLLSGSKSVEHHRTSVWNTSKLMIWFLNYLVSLLPRFPGFGIQSYQLWVLTQTETFRCFSTITFCWIKYKYPNLISKSLCCKVWTIFLPTLSYGTQYSLLLVNCQLFSLGGKVRNILSYILFSLNLTYSPTLIFLDTIYLNFL